MGKKVLISGGTGLIGSALADCLAADGVQVGIISRDPAKVPGQYQAVPWEEDSLSAALREADILVNLAGESIAGSSPLRMRWTDRRKTAILNSRVQSGQLLSRLISGMGSKHLTLVQASAIGYYGNTGPGEADESSPPGSDFLASVCQEWEAATQLDDAAGVRRIVLRIGLVLSARGGLLPLLALPFKLFAGGRIGSGSQYLSWIHIDDVANAIKFLLKDPEAEGAYNLTAPSPATNSQFSQTLGNVLNRPCWFPVPAWLIRLALGEASTLALDGRQVLPGRLLEAGYQFRYPALSAALQSLLGE